MSDKNQNNVHNIRTPIQTRSRSRATVSDLNSEVAVDVKKKKKLPKKKSMKAKKPVKIQTEIPNLENTVPRQIDLATIDTMRSVDVISLFFGFSSNELKAFKPINVAREPITAAIPSQLSTRIAIIDATIVNESEFKVPTQPSVDIPMPTNDFLQPIIIPHPPHPSPIIEGAILNDSEVMLSSQPNEDIAMPICDFREPTIQLSTSQLSAPISTIDGAIENYSESDYSNDVMSVRSLSLITYFNSDSSHESATPSENSSLMSYVGDQLFQHSIIFSQSEYDYMEGKAHSCCAITMVAFFYSGYKTLYDWTSFDLQRILEIGTEYYKLCRPTKTFLTPNDLCKQFTFECQSFEIQDIKNIQSGPMTVENLHTLFHDLNASKVDFAILIINQLSYGLIICRCTSTINYVLFDCHGRTSDGERFGSHSVMLAFNNMTSIITTLIQEFPYVVEFDLYPINFQRNFFSIGAPEIHHKQIAGRQFFHIIFGDFSQFSDNFPAPHTQCTAMSAAAIAFHSIKTVELWDNLDLNAILIAGQQYYHSNLEHVRATTSLSQFSTYLEAILLLPDLEIDSTRFRINILNDYVSGGVHDTENTLKKGISILETNKFIGGIITYKTNSYALIRCGRDNAPSYYAFFDSHGRNAVGERPGRKSAILFFNNAEDFVAFFLVEYPLLAPALPNELEAGRLFILVPIQVTSSSSTINRIEDDVVAPTHNSSNGINVTQNSLPSVENVINKAISQPNIDSTLISNSSIECDLFFDILLSENIERTKSAYHICAAASFCIITHESFTCIDEWSEDDLDLNLDNAHGFWQDATRALLNAGHHRPAEDIVDLPTAMHCTDELTINFIVSEATNGYFISLMPVLETFILSLDQHAILKIRETHYTVIKCAGSRGRIAFYDVHGRTAKGRKVGKFSAILYFVDLNQMMHFLSLENQTEFPFSFYTIKIERFNPTLTVALAKRQLFTSMISGRFSQNDSRFSIASRNSQCTANSVVFLAYTLCIKEKWQTVDIDRILTIGDCIYSVSYKEAVKVKPRDHRMIAAHEVVRKIAITTDGWRASEVVVDCEPVMELSGNFGKFAFSKIMLFFNKHNSAVFISSNKSIALYKAANTYVIFDPHARNLTGCYDDAGFANIFHFVGIRQLYRFLTREGYSNDNEFTLTAFNFKLVKKNKTNNVIRTTEFSLDDNIPLLKLVPKRTPFTSKDLPLLARNENQNSQPPSIAWSQPLLRTRDGSSTLRFHRINDIIRIEDKVRYARDKKRSIMLPDEVKEKRRLWKNYLEKTFRTKIPRRFSNADDYYAAKVLFDASTDEDDATLIALADSAEETMKRNEERIRQRIQKRDLISTHFLAYCYSDSIDETDEMYTEFRLGPMDNVCEYCGALYFAEERNSQGCYTDCCNNGAYSHNLPQRQSENYPHIFRELLDGTSALSNHFLANILLYNNAFSFGSLGASDLTLLVPPGRIGPVVIVRGMIYHVADHFRTNSSGPGLPTAQLYYIDNAAAVDERMAQSDVPLNRSLLIMIENFLRANNPYAAAYRMLGSVLREVRRRPNAPITNVNLQILRVRHDEQVAIRRNHGGDFGFPTSNEVAAVHTDLPPPGTKNIVIFPIDQPIEGGIPINSTDPNRDSYLYPILFPFSEQTWTWSLNRDFVHEGARARKRITARDFYAYILKKRAGLYSPILNAGKLTQQFIIDSWSRVQEHQMEYQQSDAGQRAIRSETYGALRDYIDNKDLFDADLPGKVIPMPSSIVGSRRYIKENYLDAMAVCSKYQKPTYLITFTCNPFCKDILLHIPKGANPIDHPQMVSRIFQLQVAELVKDIRKRHVLGMCEALIYVIEQQKRSSGHHCHLIVFIQKEDRPANPVDIDNMVSVEIPCPITQPRLYKAVTTLMFHNRCGPQSNAWCLKPGKDGKTLQCSKNFPKRYCHQTTFTDKSYPEYRRRCDGRKFTTRSGDVLDNRWIVAYNPYLLLKYNCHLNIEIISTIDSLKYLFKYFHKGLDMSKVQIIVVDGVQVYNEFQHFVDCRYLSAMAAYWRIASYTIYYNDHTIYRLPVHLEHYQRVIIHEHDEGDLEEALCRSGSELLAYFQLNNEDPDARQYLYSEIPYKYVYTKKTKSWHKRQRTNKPLVTRLNTVNYNHLELYSLRLMLMSVKGATSYEHLRHVNGIQYDNFLDASIALGVHCDDTMQLRTFEEMVTVEMPYQLRCLFANLLIYITPTDPLAFWEQYKHKMSEDYVRRNFSKAFAEQLALRHISSILTVLGFSNSHFKLPEPQIAPNDQARADTVASEYLHNRFDPIEEEIEGRRISSMFNEEQTAIFDTIVSNVTVSDGHKLFHIDGPGGTGKTFLNQGILSTLRGMGMNCNVVVWTGMGASLYKGGRTVHSTFKLPLDIQDSVGCNVSNISPTGVELRKTDVLIWDEISMVDKFSFNAVDNLFRELTGEKDKPFGGIVVITSGDNRQILPIVQNGSKMEILKRLVKHSNAWQHFRKCALTLNMRLNDPADYAFGIWLIAVGDGNLEDYPANQYYNSYVKIPRECVEPTSLVDSIYGDSFKSADIRKYADLIILSTHHEDVDMLNELVYNRMTEDVCTERTYFSTDRITNAHQDTADLYDVSMLNQLKPSGMPPHKLTLKINSVIMLLRNLNPYDGFCNGTRLIVTKLYDNCIVGEIIKGPYAGNVILIPRIRMTAKTTSASEELERIQFPVQLCFAMTINKSQSQSFKYVGLFLRKAPFAHGQLYVALSRTRSKANLKCQIFSDSLMGKLDPDSDDIFVPNIVYKEALT